MTGWHPNSNRHEMFGDPPASMGMEGIDRPFREAVYVERPRFTYSVRRDDSGFVSKWHVVWTDSETGDEITVRDGWPEDWEAYREWRRELEGRA